jgi:hypothetical protein
MSLQNEQEQLVIETLAFVKQLAEQPTAPSTTAPSTVPTPSVLPRYRTEKDLRREMQARLEAFRNRQRFLEIEREAYYQQAMQRIRMITEQRI